jgi:hypothetical protein
MKILHSSVEGVEIAESDDSILIPDHFPRARSIFL